MRQQNQEHAVKSQGAHSWTLQGAQPPRIPPASAPGPPLLSQTFPLAQTRPLWVTSARCSSPVAVLGRDLEHAGHRPHSLSHEPLAPAVVTFPFLPQARGSGPQPPSCPQATHRAASPSQTPFPGSLWTARQRAGLRNHPGPGEAGPQNQQLHSRCPSRLTSTPAAHQCCASCQLLTHKPQEALPRPQLLPSPRLCQPVLEPAAPGGSGPPHLCRCPVCPSPNPGLSLALARSYSSESPGTTSHKPHSCRQRCFTSRVSLCLGHPPWTNQVS